MPTFEYTLPGNIKGRVQAETPEEASTKMYGWLADNLDRETGVDPGIRALVGNAPTPQDRLATIRKFFPDAMPFADNFVVYDQQKKRLKLYNPEGLDWPGDIASIARPLAQMAGSIVGGTMGAIGGPVVAGVGAGVVGEAAGQAVDQAMRAFGTADTRSTGERLASAAVDVGTIGAGEALFRAPALAMKGVLGGRPKTEARQTLERYDVLGLKPRLAGDITGNRLTQGFQALLGRLPGGANVIKTAAEKTISEIENAKNVAIQGLGGVGTRQGAGEIIQEGARGFLSRFRDVTDALYDRAASLRGNPYVIAPKTVEMASEIMATIGRAMPRTGKKLTPSLYDDISADLQIIMGDGQMAYTGVPFDTLKALRSKIGERLSNPMMFDDTTRGDLKRLYASITADMDSALAGDQAAQLAFRNANAIYQRGLNYAEQAYGKLLKEGVTPEAAYKMATGQITDGGAKLGKIMQGLTRTERDMVTGSILARLGNKQKADAFNLRQFADDWNGIAPEAKNVLFRGNQYVGLRGALDDLAKVVRNSEKTMQMANTSGTATSLPFLTWLGVGGSLGYATGGGDALAALGGAAGAAATSYAWSKLLTNEKFIRWLIRPVRPNGVPAHLGRLSGIVAADPSLAGPVAQLVHGAFVAPLQEP